VYPDPRLVQRALPVDHIDESLRQLMDDMLATIYETRSIGLAATQVGVHLRLIVADVSEEQNAPLVLVNPEVLSRGMPGMAEEKCLSLPGVTGAVPRDLRIRVRALDRDQAPFELDAEGLLAVCIQHEIDHLDGTLFIDRLPWLKRVSIRRKLAAQRPFA
jgi:peptide deformylase